MLNTMFLSRQPTDPQHGGPSRGARDCDRCCCGPLRLRRRRFFKTVRTPCGNSVAAVWPAQGTVNLPKRCPVATPDLGAPACLRPLFCGVNRQETGDESVGEGQALRARHGRPALRPRGAPSRRSGGRGWTEPCARTCLRGIGPFVNRPGDRVERSGACRASAGDAFSVPTRRRQNSSGTPSSRKRMLESRPCCRASSRNQRGGSSGSSNESLKVP